MEGQKSYIIYITVKWFWWFTKTIKINVIDEDIKQSMDDITEVINESDFINIEGFILSTKNINTISYKEL